MDKERATQVFECLSSGTRVDIYRLLVRAGPAGRVAGEIALAVGLPPSNLSFHLKAMANAGLVEAEAEGRFQRYRADVGLMTELVTFLTADCCSGHPELCAALPSIARRAKRRRIPIVKKAAR